MPKSLEDKIKSGRQYRSMVLMINDDQEEKASQEEKSYKVRGYATTYNEPYLLWEDSEYRVYESVSPSAFDECDMSDVIMQYDHEGRVFARTSNNTLTLTSDEHGLLIEADLGGTQEGRNLYEEIAGGYTTKMSFGFTVTGEEIDDRLDKEGVRNYSRVITRIGKLFDVSAVSLPANDGTEISARSFCDGVIAQAEAERLKELEEKRKADILALKIKLMEVSN